MRKTLLYIVLLGILGFGVYYFVFREHDAFSSGEAAFNIADTAKVGKIFLADKKSNTILVERKNGTWILDGKYVADDGAVGSVLETFNRQSAAYPVANGAYDNVIRSMAGNSVKVEVYDLEGKKMRTFYVGGQVANGPGSYMLMEGSEQPYVVQIPGFDGYLGSRYNTNMAVWRDRLVFDVPQSQLKQVKIDYPAEPLNSFTFKQEGEGKFAVDADPVLMKDKTLNQRKVNIYSKYFEKIYCEGYINGTAGLDTLTRPDAKRCGIEITTKDGKTQKVDVYWMPINRRSKNMLTPAPGVPVQYDADRFYAVAHDYKDTIVIQRPTFEKLFRKAYEFYMADEIQGVQKFEVPKGAGDVVHPNDKK